MLLITSSYQGEPTFRMLPVNKECPYVEVVFDPSTKVLAVIGKDQKDNMKMVPRLEDSGDPQMVKPREPRIKGQPFKEQRIIIPTYHEYHVEVESEIEDFVKMFAVNSEEFNYTRFFIGSEVETDINK